ncbi:hypothetical protein [Terribacillus sp. JSM ZJ617]|uniref:hypothetical protein n=1 Tax=Terribacillus sp. JSM ZJ617 TaxID=3342119 RepID=UPI0035A821D2
MKNKRILIWALSAVVYLVLVIAAYSIYDTVQGSEKEKNHDQHSMQMESVNVETSNVLMG